MEQNREVFAIPGSPMDPRAAGTNKLIQEGAHMVTVADDIILELKSLCHNPVRKKPKKEVQTSLSFSDQPQAETEIEPEGDLYDKVLTLLSYTPVHVDEIIRQLEASTSEILTVLLDLELSGRVERHIGNKVSLL